MNTSKDYGGDLCKNHSARSEKEFCRVCPSNLNKKELENVYFTLLENNLDLKTTINSQREKIKILSTKVQRLTALQKTYLGKESKECCGAKVVVTQQKECISELRRSNQCLSERVRQLNMRLCSAKQFLKRSPFQSTSHCNRCSNKNASMSALMTKRSETNLRTTAASSQCLVKDVMSSRTVDNAIISHEKGVQYDFCVENKCRSYIEELKKQVEDLQYESLKMKEDHATAISQSERDLYELRAESVRVRSERALAAERAEGLRAELGDVTARLGAAHLRCDELGAQLAGERRRAAELRARLRAADISTRVAGLVESHLTAIKMAKDRSHIIEHFETNSDEKRASGDSSQLLAVPSPRYRPRAAVRTKVPQGGQIEDAFKSSDDSGYTEVNKSQEIDDTKAPTYINQVLLEKIADLQNQINKLKSFKSNFNNPSESFKLTKEINKENTESKAPLDTQLISEHIIPESSDSVVTEKKANINVNEVETSNNTKETDYKTQVNQVNDATGTYSKYEHNTIGNQQSNNNDGFKRRERVNLDKDSSKIISSVPNTSIDRRKFSLQDPRESHKDNNNLIKTGSLDEYKVTNTGSSNRDSVKSFDAREVLKSSNKDKISKPKNANVAKKEELNYSDRVTESDKEFNIELGAAGGKEQNIDCIKDNKRKDSDSSKGTYTIYKDDKISNFKTKSKDVYLDTNGESKKIGNKTFTCKNPLILAADVKKILMRATRNDKLGGRGKSPATYVKSRDISPDSTECEISSLSDLPSERDARSPGEVGEAGRAGRARDTSTPPTSTTDYGSLSEGELPHLRDATILSDGEKPPSYRMEKSHSVPAGGGRAERGRCGRARTAPDTHVLLPL